MDYQGLIIKKGENSGVFIKNKEMNIYIDPFQLNLINEKADLILITHGHYDHCSVEDIKKIVKFGTKIIGPSEILSQISRFDGIDFEIAEIGKRIIFNGVEIDCVASYNVNKHFHPREEGYLGYVINFNGIKIYHAGDSDFIPEMIKINAEIILLPVGGKFTMNFEEALRAIEIMRPKISIPIHWGSVVGTFDDAQKFVNGCRNIGIDSKILDNEI